MKINSQLPVELRQAIEWLGLDDPEVRKAHGDARELDVIRKLVANEDSVTIFKDLANFYLTEEEWCQYLYIIAEAAIRAMRDDWLDQWHYARSLDAHARLAAAIDELQSSFSEYLALDDYYLPNIRSFILESDNLHEELNLLFDMCCSGRDRPEDRPFSDVEQQLHLRTLAFQGLPPNDINGEIKRLENQATETGLTKELKKQIERLKQYKSDSKKLEKLRSEQVTYYHPPSKLSIAPAQKHRASAVEFVKNYFEKLYSSEDFSSRTLPPRLKGRSSPPIGKDYIPWLHPNQIVKLAKIILSSPNGISPEISAEQVKNKELEARNLID
ncbi:hypothetical protein [Aurantivibrio plasticivorans]